MTFNKTAAKRKAGNLRLDIDEASKQAQMFEDAVDSGTPAHINERLKILKRQITIVKESLEQLENEGGLK